jgi:peptide-methionine (R)-S-oxide reductase
MDKEITEAEKEWRNRLTPEQYQIMREKATEMPFTGRYVHTKDQGTYNCAACGLPLFSSDAKFDSGTGWPSFDQAIPGSVEFRKDDSHGMQRVEVACARCKSHLGHIFPDGPEQTTGQRFCINSACLLLHKGKK